MNWPHVRGVPVAVLAIAALLGAGALTVVAAGLGRSVPWSGGVAGDQRFGMVVTNHQDLSRTLQTLHTPWYIDQGYRPDPGQPPGSHRALKVRTKDLETAANLRAAALAQPGSYWIIGNEPNVPGQDDRTPDEYAQAFRYYYRTIRSVDPSARFVGPELLNFDATCQGCGGFVSGRAWLDGFRTAYRDRYADDPPVDVWSLHTYDMDWTHLPMGDAALQTAQISAFRSYLDSVPASAGHPIWLTEFAIVWGYSGVEWRGDGDQRRAFPVGEFQRESASTYLRTMLTWLTANSAAEKIERWFAFSSHGYKDPWAGSVGGIALVEATESGPRPTSFCEIMKEFAGRAR